MGAPMHGTRIGGDLTSRDDDADDDNWRNYYVMQ